ncbi:D-aminoacyl-tRNA deacylase [subsurface metagenome]
MLALIQRVKWARVEVEGEVVGEISSGLLVLLGAREGDDSGQDEFLANKVANLRIFNDAQGKMNLSLLDVGGNPRLRFSWRNRRGDVQLPRCLRHID